MESLTVSFLARLMPPLTLAIFPTLLVGCRPPAMPVPPPPHVTFTYPVRKNVQDYAYFTGTAQPYQTYEVRARVRGFLKSVEFEQGEVVEEGDLLFTIEPEQYEAELAAANAKSLQTQAKLALMEANLERGRKAFERQAISEEDFATRVAERDAAAAELLADKASIAQAELNLSYTKIKAPFRGQVGRALVDPGNLVGAVEATLLTTVVQFNPIHAYFDIDERTVLEFLKRRDAGEVDESPPIELGLIDAESGYSVSGKLDFFDNQIDANTGTVLGRAVFPNVKNLIFPGANVRLRIARRIQPNALLVYERALGTDLGGKYLLLIDRENKVERRYVELGVMVDEMRVITSGIAAKDKYIVDGLLKARPGLPVTPTELKSNGASELPKTATTALPEDGNQEAAIEPATPAQQTAPAPE